MTEEKSIKHILYQLDQLQGITRHYVLTPEDIRFIQENEDENNQGVREAVKRDYCVCLVHDSRWREPVQTIVKKEDGEIIFPPVVFPEVPAKNVVSSSPGIETHTYLAQKVRVEGDEATLLIGFDL
ncbi:MAG: hypothetical protein AABW68_04570 [archaeon]